MENFRHTANQRRAFIEPGLYSPVQSTWVSEVVITPTRKRHNTLEVSLRFVQGTCSISSEYNFNFL